MSDLAVSTAKVQARSRSGEVSSAEVLVCAFNQVRAELVSTLYFVLGNQEDAQDTAQDAFLKCWRTLEEVPEIRNMRAWIFRVALNAAKDLQRNAWRRRARNLGDAPPPEPASGPSPTDQAEERETLERVREALKGLRPEEQAVFLLRQNGDLTFEEIADIRRLPVGTVKTQMRAALQKLRGVLKER